ncbi:hypothetical protein AOLI_G00180130 [Acnodon oligacanthus]
MSRADLLLLARPVEPRKHQRGEGGANSSHAASVKPQNEKHPPASRPFSTHCRAAPLLELLPSSGSSSDKVSERGAEPGRYGVLAFQKK